jgi:lambda repressor-like predicted transcriptional regulator
VHWFAFCPNPGCAYHKAAPDRPWAWATGWYATKAFGKVRRYRCSCCGKSFSTQTFSTHYYLKRILSYRELLYRLAAGESLRGMSRSLGCSLSLLANRFERLARQGMALHGELVRQARQTEDICIDGFVSFDCSQYFPSEIPIAAGRESGFVLDVSHCTRRRSGSMRPEQKAKARQLYAKVSLERGGIGRSFREVLSTSLALQPGTLRRPFVLITDEKPEYAREVRTLAALWGEHGALLVHEKVSSRLPRTFHNPLFASNYLDRELRKDLASHHRETVCYNRNVSNGMLRLWAYLVWHNYLKPYRIRWAKGRRPLTHAQARGIAPEALKDVGVRLFEVRAFLSRSTLSVSMARSWKKEWKTPGKAKAEYVPKLALA